MQLSRVVFHGISQLSLVFCWYTSMQYFDEPVGRVKSQTTRKKICVGNRIFASKILFVANRVQKMTYFWLLENSYKVEYLNTMEYF